jgi:anti-sigma regulatory factor (Ser/Thr protein kinase)
MLAQEDTVAMAATRRAATTATVLFPHTSASVKSARRRIVTDLNKRGVQREVVHDAALVLSEILSNALRHARPLGGSGKIRVSWDVRAGAVEIDVTDGGGATRPYPAQPSISSLGGRGLGIVTTLTSDWGVRSSGTETTVWAVIPMETARIA